MNRMKLLLVGALSAVVCGLGAKAFAPTPAFADASATAFKCANDWCGPGDVSCPEQTNWGCSMENKVCLGASRCGT